MNLTNLSILLLIQVNLSFSCRKLDSSLTVRLVPDHAKLSVAYGDVTLATQKPEKLVEINCEAFGKVEWHDSKIDEAGVMRMNEVPLPLEIEKGKLYRFEPNGQHLMLKDKKRNLKLGERLTFTFRFADLSELVLFAEVKQ
ncbi:MAG: copper chaperone PCu(A)C [Leptospira sp.]|nr:copper chaperone PCu(A)C [Leptospira sp.]